MPPATALAHPNIALIKYWGNRDAALRLPANGSISMNLDGLFTRTRVMFDKACREDTLVLNGERVGGLGMQRVEDILDQVRFLAGITLHAEVLSENNFPAGAGLASSASAFAALALAASTAAGLNQSQIELSCLARRGSGSACRSIPQGFVEWQAGKVDQDSFAASIAPPEHWALVDCIAVVNSEHKATGSTEGHALAATSPLQASRLAGAPHRLDVCRSAILGCDFAALAEIAELDTNLMHAVMMTSRPPLIYWQPATLTVMHAVRAWRQGGMAVCYSVDAGPNVHVLCSQAESGEVAGRLEGLPGVLSVLIAGVGGPARLVTEH